MSTHVEHLDNLEAEARAAMEVADSVQALTEVRARYLGRKGSLSSLLRGIGELDPAERGRVGQAVNTSKARIEESFQARRLELESAAQTRALESYGLDVTLPAVASARGHLHPVSLIEREMEAGEIDGVERLATKSR